MRIKISDIKSNATFLLICMGLFFTPGIMRTTIVKSQWALINVLSWLGYFLLVKRFIKKGKISVSRHNKYGVLNPLWIILIIVLFIFESMLLPEFETISKIKYIYATILPCCVLYTKLPKDEIVRYTKIFSYVLTVAGTIVVMCGVLDMFIGVGIGNFIATFTGVDSLIESVRQGRMVSYFGHPLLTTEILILCFSFNSIVNYCIKKQSIAYTVYYSIICVVGIGLCGSKTGIILITIEFIFMYVNRRGLRHFILIVIVAYLAYSYGLLDTVIGRFIAGFESGDLTTGRNTALALVLQSGYLKFNFFVGHAGTELSERMIAALEYPPLRWAYLFGIWFAIMICVVLFIIPFVKIIKSRNMKIIIVAITLIFDVNSYNGITTQSDHMLLFCVAMFLLMNLCDALRGKENENMYISSKPVYIGGHTKGSNYNIK